MSGPEPRRPAAQKPRLGRWLGQGRGASSSWWFSRNLCGKDHRGFPACQFGQCQFGTVGSRAPEGREIISNFSDYGTSIVTGRALGWRRLGQQDMRAETEKDDKTRLLEAASALIAQGHAKFSIAALCEEARVDRDVFRTHFSGRAELMTLLEE